MTGDRIKSLALSVLQPVRQKASCFSERHDTILRPLLWKRNQVVERKARHEPKSGRRERFPSTLQFCDRPEFVDDVAY